MVVNVHNVAFKRTPPGLSIVACTRSETEELHEFDLTGDLTGRITVSEHCFL